MNLLKVTNLKQGFAPDILLLTIFSVFNTEQCETFVILRKMYNFLYSCVKVQNDYNRDVRAENNS